MKLLIAEDDVFFRRLLQRNLSSEYEIIEVENGDEALAALQRPDSPPLAILDWVMPGVSGPEICRSVRQSELLSSKYLILLTARNSSADIVAGLRAGADDYVTKPFSVEELQARVRVGKNILGLQAALTEQLAATKAALARERHLQDLLLSVSCQKADGSDLYRQDWNGIDACLGQKVEAHGNDCECCMRRARALSKSAHTRMT